jgi:hypothetical protein
MKSVIASFAIAAALLTVPAAHAAYAPQACLTGYPGPIGKACCEKSYAASAEGTMDSGKRAYELQTCFDNATKSKKK